MVCARILLMQVSAALFETFVAVYVCMYVCMCVCVDIMCIFLFALFVLAQSLAVCFRGLSARAGMC